MRRSVWLPLPRPFSVSRTLSFLRASSLRTPYLFPSEKRAGRLVYLGGRPGAIEFHFPEGRQQVRVTWVDLEAQAVAGRTASPSARILRELASHIWGTGDDLAQCYAQLRRDPTLASLARRNYGLRLVRASTLYEALLVAIIGQQLSVIAAEAIRRRLLLTLGDNATIDGLEYRGYPSPRQLLAAPIRRIQAAGTSRPKAHYIRELAARATAGELDHWRFHGVPDEACIQQLLELPGVGRWTAEIGLMRGLGRLDVFPAADLGLAVAAQRTLRLRTRPNERRLRALGERWKGWRSYAALFLWTTLAGGP